MITHRNIKEIFKLLISDEDFCRLVVYGSNPFNEDLENITQRPDVLNFMRERIKFSLQVNDIEDKEEVRLLLFKNYCRLSGTKSVIRSNSIELDIFVPHRLVQEELRIYEIEDKICSLLDGKIITGIGTLDYVEGRFMLSPVNGYSLYRMLFETKEGRPINMHGRI